MRSIVLVLCGLMSEWVMAGDMEELKTKIADLEKRVVELEHNGQAKTADRDQCWVKMQERVKRFREKELRKKMDRSIDSAKLEMFLKEYLDVAFGDSIDRFNKQRNSAQLWSFMSRSGKNYGKGLTEIDGFKIKPIACEIPIANKYWFFDKAKGWFLDGKLFYVELFACLDKRYSAESCDSKNESCMSNLAERVCIKKDRIVNWDCLFSIKAHVCGLQECSLVLMGDLFNEWTIGDYCFGRGSEVKDDGRHYVLGILNWKLGKQYVESMEKNSRAKGEALPDPE